MAEGLTLDTHTPDEPVAKRGRRSYLGTSRPARGDIVAVGAFFVLTVGLFRTAWRSPMTTWVGGPGDPPVFMWFLRWMPHALANGENPLFTHHINFPDGVNLMWNTGVPLPAFLLTPITLFVGPILAYNVLITTAVALSGCCAYAMLRRYVTSRPAAFAGALLYGFSPYIYTHANEHPNLAAAFVPPLLFLLLDDLLVRQGRPARVSGLLLGGLAFVQFAISEELLATEFLVATLGLGLLVVLHHDAVRAHGRHAATALGVGLATALALAGLPLLFQFFGPYRVRSGAIWGPEIFATDLLGLVIPTSHLHLSAPWTTEITNTFTEACCPSEWGSYLGVPLIGLMIVVTARMWSTPLVRFTGLLAGIIVILALGPHLHVGGLVTPLSLPFAKLIEAPVIRNMFAERLMLYVYLMAAILVAVTVDSLLRQPRRKALAVGVAVFVLFPLLPKLDFPATRATTPVFFRTDVVQRIPKNSVMLVAPFSRDTSTSEPMLWQAEADMRYRMPASYALGPDRSGRYTYLPLATPLSTKMEQIQRGAVTPALDDATRATFVTDLARADVRSVAIGPMQNREAMVAFFQDLLGQAPTDVGGVTLWTDLDPTRLR